jgi:hypothetical protein
MPNQIDPKPPAQWLRHIVFAVIALMLAWVMLRAYAV